MTSLWLSWFYGVLMGTPFCGLLPETWFYDVLQTTQFYGVLPRTWFYGVSKNRSSAMTLQSPCFIGKRVPRYDQWDTAFRGLISLLFADCSSTRSVCLVYQTVLSSRVFQCSGTGTSAPTGWNMQTEPTMKSQVAPTLGRSFHRSQ